MVLPAPDTDEKNGLNLLRRLWVVKFDKEEEIDPDSLPHWELLNYSPSLRGESVPPHPYIRAFIQGQGAHYLTS